MKTIKIHLKIVAIFFSTLILLQGCTVYKSANVTLEEAVRAETVVRVKTNENKTVKYDRVSLENNKYYGLLQFRGEQVKTLINEVDIERVQIKDKTWTALLTFVAPIVLIGGFIGISASNGSCCGY